MKRVLVTSSALVASVFASATGKVLSPLEEAGRQRGRNRARRKVRRSLGGKEVHSHDREKARSAWKGKRQFPEFVALEARNKASGKWEQVDG